MTLKPPSNTVSLADVARHAGVSPATASKALNAKSDVSEATRSRVEESARQLGYYPNALARGLMGARTGTVGVITSDLEGRFALPILMGVEDALGADRVLTFLCDARGDSERELHLVSELRARRVDGIIAVGSQTDARPSLGDVGVPVVYVYDFSDDPADSSLSIDNVQIGRIATEHITGLGRRRIAHISGEFPHSAAQDRYAGLIAHLDSVGLELATPPLFGDWSEGWGRAAAAMVLERAPEIDAVVCGSDQIARGVLDALLERGVDVPTAVAVIGVDNWEVLAENSRPALTTVDLDLKRLGQSAARRLQALSRGARNPGIERMPGHVVIRDSTIPRR